MREDEPAARTTPATRGRSEVPSPCSCFTSNSRVYDTPVPPARRFQVTARAVALLSVGIPAVVVAEPPVLRYVPKHEELKYTFGRVAPTHRITPGTRIVSWTEDCFDGALNKPGQKPSAVLVPGRDNPQTGPFYVEGAEPGDTLVVRIEKLAPARDYAVSVASPGSGSLTCPDKTPLLGPELPATA